jgi:hypothetical protein
MDRYLLKESPQRKFLLVVKIDSEPEKAYLGPILVAVIIGLKNLPRSA